MRLSKSGIILLSVLFFTGVSIWGCGMPLGYSQNQEYSINAVSVSKKSSESIPAYNGQTYCVLNGNIPEFEDEEITDRSYESYSRLDELGRCQTAIACIGKDLMPTQEREGIGQIKPSGWHTVKYDWVEGKYLYNRCHLIGYQLTAENANERNLITGTRYFNTEGMLPFENMVADYIKETGNHVMYRVTPVYENDNLVADGVKMEGYSVEDNGEGISYNVFVYNVQPGVEIDYATGESKAAEQGKPDTESEKEREIRGNKSSKIYHCPGQASYDEMKDSKNLIIFNNEEEAEKAGYRKAKR